MARVAAEQPTLATLMSQTSSSFLAYVSQVMSAKIRKQLASYNCCIIWAACCTAKEPAFERCIKHTYRLQLLASY